VGIFVAIPAVVAYNVFQKKSEEIETHAQSLARLVTAWLHTYPEARNAEAATDSRRVETKRDDAKVGRDESGDSPLVEGRAV